MTYELDEPDPAPICRSYVIVDTFMARTYFVSATLVASIKAKQ